MSDSEYLQNLNNKEIEAFNQRLKTGRPGKTRIWNYPNSLDVKVRALGWLHPDQFKEQVGTNYAQMEWDDLSDDFLHKNVDYDMNDLTQSVKEHGVLRPVAVTREKYEEAGQRRIVQDGHHRIVAAIRAGVPIPTWEILGPYR